MATTNYKFVATTTWTDLGITGKDVYIRANNQIRPIWVCIQAATPTDDFLGREVSNKTDEKELFTVPAGDTIWLRIDRLATEPINVYVEAQDPVSGTLAAGAATEANQVILNSMLTDKTEYLAPIPQVWADGGVEYQVYSREFMFYDDITNSWQSQAILYSVDGINWGNFATLTGTFVRLGHLKDPVGLTVLEQNLSPVDLFGNPTGQVLKEVRTYDNGVLVSTEYQNTTTGAIVTLPAGTAQLAPVSGLDKEVIILYDDSVPFLRHIAYNYNTMPIQTYDTLLDGLTQYAATGTVTAGAFGDATAANQATQITIAQNQANEIGSQTDTTVQNGNDGTLISLIKGISKSLYAMFDRFVNKQITVDRFEYTSAGVISIPTNCTKIDIYIPVAASIEIDGRPLPSQVDNLVISDDHGRVLSVGTINVTAVGSDPVFVLTYSFN